MLYHHIEEIGRFDVPNLIFTVARSNLGYFFVVNGVKQKGTLTQTVNADGDHTYTYSRPLKAGSLFEFYYIVPLTQEDTFAKETADIMSSKAICRINYLLYSSSGSIVNGYGIDVIVSKLSVSPTGYILVPAVAGITLSKLDLLDYLVEKVEARENILLSDIKSVGLYYMITNKANAGIQIYGNIKSKVTTNFIGYGSSFNVYPVDIDSRGSYTDFRFCGDDYTNDVETSIPKLPVKGTYKYNTDQANPEFSYSPSGTPYSYTKDIGSITQTSRETINYNVSVLYSRSIGGFMTRLTSVLVSASEKMPNVTIELQNRAGYYSIVIGANRADAINNYYPYDTSLINAGVIEPKDFWVKTKVNNITTYRTKEKVAGSNTATMATTMEFTLL